jgi:dihydroorotate dehydrogenase (NAD+) catalytic subunit
MKTCYQAIVRKCEHEKKGSDVYLLEFELQRRSGFSASPGQFIVLEPGNKRSVMPRPFSIVDIEGDVVSVLVKVVGKNTKAYSKLKPNDRIEIIGPQGSAIPTNSNVESYILVGGGIGGAALTLLTKELSKQRKTCTVLLGARDMSQISGKAFFEKCGAKLTTITEVGNGRTGFVTELLEDITKDDGGSSTVVACGPTPMLKKVAEICAKYNNFCLVMLEEVMACGMGSCKGCAVFGKDGSVKHVCTDGPAIDADWIDWQKMVPVSITDLSESVDLEKIAMVVDLGNVKLDYPTMNASGCLAIDALEEGRFDIAKLGALLTKGVTVMKKTGNVMPRTCETPAGMINSIGLENIGLDTFIQEELPRWLALEKPVFVNISGFSIEDYIQLAQAVEKTEAVGVEVNISCPNIKYGGITFGIDPKLAFEVTKAVRQVTSKHVIVKLTPNVTDIVSIARASVAGGADSISLINTIQAMAIDPFTRRPKIGTMMGGLSGPAIRPVAVRMVHQLFQANLGVPIIGMGGIEDGESASEFFIAGANVVATGTGGFSNRQVFSNINDELKKLVAYHGFSSIKQLVGSMITG